MPFTQVNLINCGMSICTKQIRKLSWQCTSLKVLELALLMVWFKEIWYFNATYVSDTHVLIKADRAFKSFVFVFKILLT